MRTTDESQAADDSGTTVDVESAEEAEVVDEFGTGFQLTRVTRHADGGIRWQRSPGRNRKGPYPAVPAGFVRRALAASDPHLRFATPLHAGADHGIWGTHGRRSVARALLAAEGDPDGRLYDTLGRLGDRLRVLHEQPADPQFTGSRPAGPDRLEHWLAGGRGTRAGSGFHARLRSRLGPGRFEKLRSFTAELLRPQPQPATLHGWLTLGSIVLPDRPGPGRPAVVLSGLEAAAGRVEADVSSVLGELEEFRIAAENDGDERPELQALATAFLTGYGDGWDAATVAAGAVVRIAVHAHDFANYVGWHAELHAYVPMLADLLDADGTTALPPAPPPP